MPFDGKPSRWRWNPVEKLWEVNQGNGWHESFNLMKGMGPSVATPFGARVEQWEETKAEPHWTAEASSAEPEAESERLTLKEEIDLGLKHKRKQRSDKGKKRGKRKSK